MPKFRVLVVDDAVVVRKLITETLRLDPDLEVVLSTAAELATAANSQRDTWPASK